MTELAPNDLKDLIVRFVQTYSAVNDIELDLHLNPKLSFMPLNSYLAKREAAHYFLLAALTGNPRNIRLLLNHLSTAFEGKLYTIKNPLEFKCESIDLSKK